MLSPSAASSCLRGKCLSPLNKFFLSVSLLGNTTLSGEGNPTFGFGKGFVVCVLLSQTNLHELSRCLIAGEKVMGKKGRVFFRAACLVHSEVAQDSCPMIIYIFFFFSLFYNSYCMGYQQSEGGRAVTPVCWGRNFPVLQRDSQAKDDLRTCSNWGLPETLLCLGHVSFFSRANY